MKTKRLNGTLFEKMLRNGLAALRLREQEINDLNVFPVADGDTGTNMCLTVENAVRSAQAKPELCYYLKDVSEGMLLGARGNSGVILSQIFKGMYLELSRCAAATPGDLRNALIRAYKVAYASVVQPVEGTMLTVAREGVEHIRTQVDRSTTIETLLSMYAAEMRKTLSYTPEMLDVLKDAGVVDSGALGFITLIEGMLKYLYGELIEPGEPAPVRQERGVFDENSAFEQGYCMEFVLQLMRGEPYCQHFRLDTYTGDLGDLGDSLVAVLDGRRVKVHIHTKKPARLIALSQEYGEFISFKLENMQIQHNEHAARRAARKPLAIVAAANGAGVASLFSGLGCDAVIDGGATMNTSAQEFLDAFAGLEADAIVVLPDNANVIPAAEQAAELSGRKGITVLPTKSIAEGYCALAMDIPDSSDTDYRISQMRLGLECVVTLTQTAASRDFSYREISCRKGDELALIGGEIVCVADGWLDAVRRGLAAVPGIEEKENCIVFRGEGVPPGAEEELAAALAEDLPMLEVTFIDGGQSVYRWVLGIF